MCSGLVFGAFINIVSLNMLGEACLKINAWSYESLSETLVPGKVGIWLAGLSSVMMVLNCAGSMVAYCIIIGDIFDVLITDKNGVTPMIMDSNVAWGEFLMPFVVLAILLPLSLSPRIGMLRYLAAGGVFAMFFLIMTFVYVIIKYGPDPSIENASTIFGFHDGPTMIDFVNVGSTVTFAYSNQYNMPQVAAELSRSSMRRVRKVSSRSTLIAALLFICSVVFGLIAFGVGENQMKNIVLDFRELKKNILRRHLTKMFYRIKIIFIKFVPKIKIQFAKFTFSKRKFCWWAEF